MLGRKFLVCIYEIELRCVQDDEILVLSSNMPSKPEVMLFSANMIGYSCLVFTVFQI